MKILKFTGKVILFTILLTIGSCEPAPEVDPCLKTKWPQTKEFEIKLAVHVLPTNPLLPGGAVGSQNPVDFEKMLVYGTIEKVDCSEKKSDPYNLGNSYITKGVDLPAPIDEPKAYWIGHVVYVYELGNDKDHLNIKLTVQITMMDNQSYMCTVSEEIFSPQIVMVPGEMYYYVLLDIYSNSWVKV